MFRSGKMLGLAVVAAFVLSTPAMAGDRPTRTPIPPKDHDRPTRTPIDLGERTRKPTKAPVPTRTPLALTNRTSKPTQPPTPTRTALVKQPNVRPPTKTARPTRTPLVIEQRPTKPVPPTRTPITLEERTRKPTAAPAPTRTPIVKEHAERPPTKTPRPTRTPLVLEARPQKATRTPAPTRTPIIKQHAERPPTKAPRPTRTPLILEDRPQKPTKTARPTRTPVVKEHAERPPTKTLRPTRTPVVKDHADGPTRTPLVIEARPTKTARPTRTPLVIEQREGKPTKTPRPTRTPLGVEERTRKPTPEARPTRTPLATEERTAKPTKTARPTRTPIEKAHAEPPPTKAPRPTRTAIPTKTATPIPQFNPANVTASCRAILKKDVVITLTVTNRSGASIFDVQAGSLDIQRAPGTNFVLGPAPSGFTRVNPNSYAVFKWRGSFRSSSGACGFSASARARGPGGETIELPLTDCGTVVLGHGLGEADLVPPCGSGAGEGGAEGCGDSEPGPGGSGALPDLTIDVAALGSSVMFQTRNFPPGDCALVEGCVAQPGVRRLLRFSTVTPNIGAGDVFFGDPRAGGNFVYSSCHQHYHFNGYANYRLIGAGNQTVAAGHKQAFCLIDLEPIRGDAGPPKYHCLNQGISAGWADVYDRQLDCQWIDITDVPPGTYTLEVVIDPGNIIRESNDGNNVGRVSVTIPPQ
jgi:hypothetical protein